jgi:hypothetical protein
LEIDLLSSDSHQFLPVSLLHEFGMQLRDQWQNCVHILDSIVKSKEGLEVLNVLILGTLRVALLGLHIFDLCHKSIGVNLVPKSGFPGLKLVVNQGDKIPHLFQVLKVVSAILQ